MADIRIDNAFIVTMDNERRVIEEGSIAIERDRIVAIGETAEIAKAHPAETVIDGARKAVMPGFIDVHAHAGHGLIKTMGGGDGDAWYDTCAEVYTTASDTEFWRAEAALAGLERLKAGVTTGISLLGGGDSVMRTDEPQYAAAHLDAIRELGIRVVLALGPTRPPHPWTYARWEKGVAEKFQVSFEQQIETCEQVIRDHHNTEGGRLNICMLSPTLRAEHLNDASQSEIDDLIHQAKKACDVARAHDLVFTQDGHTTGTVAFAKSHLGILGPKALLSHSTDFTDDEIAICADLDVKIAHNPSAVASIYKRCKAIEMMQAGITVAIGSDGTAPDRSGDMFRHMQQCMHYHRRHFRDSSVLPPGKVMEMATIDAAKALGMEQEIGSLETGKKADLITIDLAKPHLYPLNMPLYRIACFANGADVDTVIANGKLLMQGRKVTSVDELKVLDAAQIAAETMLDRTGRRALLDTPNTFFNALHY